MGLTSPQVKAGIGYKILINIFLFINDFRFYSRLAVYLVKDNLQGCWKPPFSHPWCNHCVLVL